MSKIELYTSAFCPYAQRVRLVLAEKRLQATEIEIDLRNKPADFLAICPAGKVPLLVYKSTHLWESAVINEYIEEAFPEHPLLPRTPEQRALARLWISFADAKIYEPTHRLMLCTNPCAQKKIAGQLAEELRFLEKHALATHDGPYLLADQFSLADLAYFPWFEQVAVLEHFRKFQMPACSRILAWREAVSRRECVRATARTPEFYLRGYTSLFDRLSASGSLT